MRLPWIVAATLLLGVSTVADAGQFRTLGSGKTVEFLGVGPLQSTKGWSGLMLKYRTQVPLDDLSTLRKEVDEIWERFVVDVERRGYQTAFISANEPEKGFVVTTNKSFTFVFEKRSGAWRTLESKAAKLDEGFVRQFVDRIDWAYRQNEMNVLLLFMANDWTLTSVGPGQEPASRQIVDRMKFLTVTRSTLRAASALEHQREITGISIDDNGNAARVESRETTTATLNGRRLTLRERTINSFELRDNVVLWTKSESVIEEQTETKSNNQTGIDRAGVN